MVRKDGGAISATSSWQVNGSEAQGRKMVNDISRLMLHAYNAEADNLVRAMKPYKLDSAKDRLDKVATTIAKLGTSMMIAVSVCRITSCGFGSWNWDSAAPSAASLSRGEASVSVRKRWRRSH